MGVALTMAMLGPGCDTSTDSEPSVDDVAGYWRQVGCSDVDGAEIACLVPVSEFRRDFEIDADGDVRHLLFIDGVHDGAALPAEYVEGQICQDIAGCFDAPLLDGALLYCLTDSACEMFERD